MSNDHNQTLTPDVLFVSAVEFELRPFAQHMEIEITSGNVTYARRGNRCIALLVAGVGRRGDENFSAAIRDLRPLAVINVGIAGGLHRKYPAGSTWVVEEWRHQVHPHSPAGRADATLSTKVANTLKETGIACGKGIAVTVDEPLHDAEERDHIRIGSSAHLVEMEGAEWATIAAEHRVPFAAVRVISDPADRPLPAPRSKAARRAWLLRDDGTIHKRRFLLALIATTAWLRPWQHLRELKAAGGQFREAVDALEAIARALLADR